MDYSNILDYLQLRFAGQLVLYVDDMAVVLGKSEKAIANLIARKALPFKVKTVGGLRCVDIFQVAQWLSSDEDMAADSIAAEVSPTPSKLKPKSAKPVKLIQLQESVPAEAPPVLTGKLAAKLLSMRPGQTAALGRFVHSLRNIDDVVFMNDVLEKLFYTVDMLSSSYLVTLKRLAPKGSKVLSEESRKYFATEDDAAEFMMLKLSNWRLRKQTSKYRSIEHFVMEHSGQTLFHAITCNHKLAVVNNVTGFEFSYL